MVSKVYNHHVNIFSEVTFMKHYILNPDFPLGDFSHFGEAAVAGVA